MFRASRLSSGNHLFPTQVLITPTSVVQYTPRWIGRQEETIHMAHIASVKIDTGLLLSNVLIETSGGTDPIALPRASQGRCGADEGPDRALSDRLLPAAARPALSAGPRPADNLSATMDDLTFSARRASAARDRETAEPADLDTRFRTLVQSPLRAGILRYLSARPDESFDVESLMQTFGRLRLDVENCVRELVDFGVARTIAGDAAAYMADAPGQRGARRPARSLPRTPRRRSAPKTSRRRCSASAR